MFSYQSGKLSEKAKQGKGKNNINFFPVFLSLNNEKIAINCLKKSLLMKNGIVPLKIFSDRKNVGREFKKMMSEEVLMDFIKRKYEYVSLKKIRLEDEMFFSENLFISEKYKKLVIPIVIAEKIETGAEFSVRLVNSACIYSNLFEVEGMTFVIYNYNTNDCYYVDYLKKTNASKNSPNFDISIHKNNEQNGINLSDNTGNSFSDIIKIANRKTNTIERTEEISECTHCIYKLNCF